MRYYSSIFSILKKTGRTPSIQHVINIFLFLNHIPKLPSAINAIIDL